MIVPGICRRHRSLSKALLAMIAFATTCMAQNGLTIVHNDKQKTPDADVEGIYRAACAVIQKEYGGSHSVEYSMKLMVGSDENQVDFIKKEIRLTKWNRDLFAQGVVILASDELMIDRRAELTHETLSWANATVDVTQLGK
jgi:hypothetical protein